jgi:hypothetical protein
MSTHRIISRLNLFEKLSSFFSRSFLTSSETESYNQLRNSKKYR